MVESQKRKNRGSSNSSIERRDSETSSPVDKRTRSVLREDEDNSQNMLVSDKIQHILEKLGKLDTLQTLLTKTLAKLEKLVTHVNDLDLRVETLEAKCCGHDKAIGEMKASAEFINQQFAQNKVLFNDKTSEEFKKQKSQIHQLNKELLYLEAYSRRENLIITGIPEAQDATEDTLKVLQNFMEHELNVSDAANIDVQWVHRLGKPMRLQELYMYSVVFIFRFRKITQEVHVSFYFLRLSSFFSSNHNNVFNFYFNLHTVGCNYVPYVIFCIFFFTLRHNTKGVEVY